MAFMGETIRDNLPVLVQAPTDTINNRALALAFELREVEVPKEAEVLAYFTSAGASNLMNPIAMTHANTLQVTQLCPVRHAWAAYFLDSRTPHGSWQIGSQLISSRDMASERDKVLPFAKLASSRWRQTGLCSGGSRYGMDSGRP